MIKNKPPYTCMHEKRERERERERRRQMRHTCERERENNTPENKTPKNCHQTNRTVLLHTPLEEIRKKREEMDRRVRNIHTHTYTHRSSRDGRRCRIS